MCVRVATKGFRNEYPTGRCRADNEIAKIEHCKVMETLSVLVLLECGRRCNSVGARSFDERKTLRTLSKLHKARIASGYDCRLGANWVQVWLARNPFPFVEVLRGCFPQQEAVGIRPNVIEVS